jgi:phosphohistidine swiveling domain-containing protein
MSTHALLADHGILSSAVLAEQNIGPGSPFAGCIGHKAANLAWLATHGYRVPPFFVLTSQLCARLLAPAQAEVDALLDELDTDDPASLRRCSAAIRARVTAVSIPEDIGAALAPHITGLGITTRLAVRSSVSGEDSARNSFAGQMDTALNVGPDDVPPAVLRCLSSAYSERALFYRAHRGLLGEEVAAAVIVQVMADSAVSGVVFSCNPQSGSTSEAVVSAGLGLGEGVVSATVDCDTFFVDVRSRSINARVVNPKSGRVVALTGGGTTLKDGAPRTDPALPDERVLELAAIAVRLAEALSGPQDVEWTLDRDGVIHVLQTRPVTAIGAKETVFDNVNVVESYPGLTSPLTFTFVQRAYSEVFRTCHRNFGATRKTVTANGVSVYPYLLASIHGRMYYNITNWYNLFLQIPGMDFAIAGWEAALGIENRYKRPQPRGRPARLRRYLLLARAAAILLYGWLRLPRRLKAFFRGLREAKSSLDQLVSQDNPAHQRDAHALVAWLERHMDELARAYSAQIFNDFVAQQLFGVVEILLQRSGVENAPALRNELFCGESGVQSVDPVRSALELTDAARCDPRLRVLILSDAPDGEVWAAIAGDRRFAEFHARCREHIAAYGDRTINELKLETDTMDAQPAQLVAMVRNYLRTNRRISEMEAREQEIRRCAEHTVMAAVNRSLPRRVLFAFALRQARETVKQRENMRLGRSRCFGLAKRVYRALGAEFHDAGVLDDPRDIFFLTYQEVTAITRGTFVDADPRQVVAHRKRDHERWLGEPLDSRIVTSGIAMAHEHEPGFAEHQHGDVLTGVGCAPGQVRAPALVLTDPAADTTINGEILVATTTDPGWVFLMVAAAGLVSEKGSILSHTAIIGRELGIPTVVGVAGATRRVHDGDVVAIDGRQGTVTIEKELLR